MSHGAARATLGAPTRTAAMSAMAVLASESAFIGCRSRARSIIGNLPIRSWLTDDIPHRAARATGRVVSVVLFAEQSADLRARRICDLTAALAKHLRRGASHLERRIGVEHACQQLLLDLGSGARLRA